VHWNVHGSSVLVAPDLSSRWKGRSPLCSFIDPPPYIHGLRIAWGTDAVVEFFMW